MSSAIVDDEIEVPVVRKDRPGPGGERTVHRDVDRSGHGPQHKLLRRPGVHDGPSLLQHTGEGFQRKPRRTAVAPEQAGTGLVDPLHLGEVRGCLGLPGENRAHELRFVGNAESPVEALFVSQSRLRYPAERLAAGGPRAMPGPDLEVIGLGPEPLQRSEQLTGAVFHGSAHLGGALEKIGTPHVPHEDEVSGERPHRLRRCSRVGHQQREVLWSVPRNVQDVKLDRSNSYARPLAQRGCIGLGEVSVAPAVPARLRQIQVSARAVG